MHASKKGGMVLLCGFVSLVVIRLASVDCQGAKYYDQTLIVALVRKRFDGEERGGRALEYNGWGKSRGY